MPTLRTRPSRGSDVLPDAVKSPSKTPTRRGRRKSTAADAMEVHESIEAKGEAADQDDAMEDAIDAAGERQQEDTRMEDEADAQGDDVDADGEADEDVDADADDDADADGEPDDGSVPSTQNVKELNSLIDETQLYLSNYQEE